MRYGFYTVSALLLLMRITQAQQPPLYRDAARPVEERVADLLHWMTLDEKVAQLQGIWVRKNQIQDADGRFDPGVLRSGEDAGSGNLICATDQHIAARPAQGAEPFARERHVQPLREQPQLFGIARPLCNHVNEQVAHAFFHSLVYARSEDLSRIVPQLLGK